MCSANHPHQIAKDCCISSEKDFSVQEEDGVKKRTLGKKEKGKIFSSHVTSKVCDKSSDKKVCAMRNPSSKSAAFEKQKKISSERRALTQSDQMNCSGYQHQNYRSKDQKSNVSLENVAVLESNFRSKHKRILDNEQVTVVMHNGAGHNNLITNSKHYNLQLKKYTNFKREKIPGNEYSNNFNVVCTKPSDAKHFNHLDGKDPHFGKKLDDERVSVEIIPDPPIHPPVVPPFPPPPIHPTIIPPIPPPVAPPFPPPARSSLYPAVCLDVVSGISPTVSPAASSAFDPAVSTVVTLSVSSAVTDTLSTVLPPVVHSAVTSPYPPPAVSSIYPPVCLPVSLIPSALTPSASTVIPTVTAVSTVVIPPVSSGAISAVFQPVPQHVPLVVASAALSLVSSASSQTVFTVAAAQQVPAPLILSVPTCISPSVSPAVAEPVSTTAALQPAVSFVSSSGNTSVVSVVASPVARHFPSSSTPHFPAADPPQIHSDIIVNIPPTVAASVSSPLSSPKPLSLIFCDSSSILTTVSPAVSSSPSSEILKRENCDFFLGKEQKNLKAVSENDENSDISSGCDHIRDITHYLKFIEKNKLISNDTAGMVLKDLNKAIKGKFPGSSVTLYGSYSCDLAVSTSNLNFALQTKCKVQNSLLLEIKKCLSKELEKYDVLPFDEAAFVKKSKICVIEPYTGMVCELMYLGRSEESAHKIANLLKSVCAFDHRIKTLFIATRIWAEVCSILEAEDGKLPPIAFSLMVIHFLQQLEKPLLPIIDIYMESWGLKNHQKLNTSTLGELWLEFLNYYQTFNWEDHVVSVLHKHPVLKSSKSWSTWIAVEDPFSQKNIAESVNSSDVANFIKFCFTKFYGYFSLPPNVQVDGDSLENPEGKRRYSFSSCDLQCASTCEICENLGKTCEGCLISPTLAIEELPELSPSTMKKVDRVLMEIYEDCILPEKQIHERKAFVHNLEVYVKKVFRYAQLTLFGSSVNGFGFKASDLDICLTLKNRRKENISPRQILQILRNHLRKNKEFKNIWVVWGAQIPIIKFYCIPRKFRCEISLYNILAVHNSVLLRTYSLLDERCKILGCALKLLAKKASIAETVSRTLSSYSYILMVIHYLQQVKPPVLPVLPILDQNIFEESLDIPTEIAEKHDWLCKDIQILKALFNKESRNESTVGQLWLGLLKFYIQIKPDYVISIRQKEAVPVSELPKSSSLYNIQDPFLYKNLGCIVSEQKASTIWATLNRARFLFGTEIPSSVKDLKAYYFSCMNLTGKFVSNEECDLCGKYDHSKNNCPNN